VLTSELLASYIRNPKYHVKRLAGKNVSAILCYSRQISSDGSTFWGMWHVWTLNRIAIGSLWRRSDHPVIGGDLVDALVPPGWGRLILMYSQSTSGSTQPKERPVTARSGDISSTWQHSVMRHVVTEEEETIEWLSDKYGNTPPQGHITKEKETIEWLSQTNRRHGNITSKGNVERH